MSKRTHTTDEPQAIRRKFSSSIAQRLERVDEQTLSAMLDEIEADRKVLDAVRHSQRDATPPRPLSELREELT